MKVDVQRFYSLCAFAERGYRINFDMDNRGYSIGIFNMGLTEYRTKIHPDPDSAMSEALRFLRKQK